MRQFTLIAAIIGFVAFACCARAYGADKPIKPVVCRNYTIAKNLGICQDGKKPVVLTRFSEVRVEGPKGKRRSRCWWGGDETAGSDRIRDA